MSLKLRQLQHLLALEQHGSFVQAATALHITQPALSRSIQALEAQVGAPLFLREGHGVAPTDLGRVLLTHAREITRLSDSLQQVIGRQALGQQHLTLGAGPMPSYTIVGPAMARFMQLQAHVTVRVDIRNWDELLLRLRSHELDMFVAEISTLLAEDDLHVLPMARHPLCFVVRPDHALAGQATVDMGQVFRYPLLSPSRVPPRLLEPVMAALAQAAGPGKKAKPFPALVCPELSVLKQVVASTDAIMASTLCCVRTELERGELAVLGTAPWMHLHYGLVMRKTNAPVSAAQACLRDCVVQAEGVVSADEMALVARWGAAVLA